MRIMVDTNVLLSAIVFGSEWNTRLIEKIAEEHSLVLCSYVVDELYRVVKRKKPNKTNALDRFLLKLSFEHVFSPRQVDENERLFQIRDENDYIILHTAIIEGIDILITSDKDFFDIDIEHPEILAPVEFLQKY